MITRHIHVLYGNLRGYNRGVIRRDVARNAGLTPVALRELQVASLASRVGEAVRRFPVYRAKVAAQGLSPDDLAVSDPLALTELWPRLPVWTREDQNRLFTSLDGPPLPGAFPHATGGSTGQPTRLYMTRESYEWRTAVSDRGYAWAGAEPGRKALFVWGAPIVPPQGLKRLTESLAHAFERRRFFNSFEFGPESMARCCRAIDRYRPEVLVGYAGNLAALAAFAREQPGRLRHRARSIVTAAEGLLPGQRALLKEFLGDEVFLSYGSREFMLIGMECSRHAGYHLSTDNLVVEVVDEHGNPMPPNRIGRILVTDLHNDANPFIRYEIGDLGSREETPCACGLPFPRLRSVDGRLQETIEKPDGSRVTALFLPHLMKEFPEVQGYQVVQTAPDEICLNVMSSQPLPDGLGAQIRSLLADKTGPAMRIAIRRVDALRKNHSGKTPIVVRD